jgi:NlpC/P60 family
VERLKIARIFTVVLVISLSLASASAAAGTEYTHTLQPGQRLYPGDILYSPNHAYRLVMQGDGNLVLYSGGTALWSSKTNGQDGASAVMQGDGNFVVYRSGKAIWNSNTDHHGGAFLDMQDDGNLVIYQSGKALWSTGTGRSASHRPARHTVGSGYRLRPGSAIYSSNRRYRLVMQGDGNLVVYKGGRALWSSRTQHHGGASAVMQGDGNLVVYWRGKALWSSGTNGHDGAILNMQDDGNLVIYWHGRALWASKQAVASSQGRAIVRAAAKWAGTRYCWAGGNKLGPTRGTRDPYNGLACGPGTVGFDCTGLTLYAVYQATHILLPHGTGQAFAAGGVNVARSALKPGDLVFFGPSLSNFTHAGVYAGGGRMWDAQTEGVPVQMHGLYRNYVGARRFWR